MSTSPSPNPDADLLVAYLDGELERNEAKQVEQRLASDAEFHRLMMEHQKAWRMLDALPRFELDESFAHSTIEMIAVQAEQEAREKDRSQTGTLRTLWLATAAIALLAAVAGFAMTKHLVDTPNRRLLQQLPVIEELQAYERAGSLEFLEELQGRGLFAESPRGAPNAENDADLNRLGLAARREFVNQLPETDKRRLAQQREAFGSLSPGRQAELNALHQELVRSDQAEALRQVLLNYDHWLQNMSGEDRTALLSLPPEERLDAIEKRVRDEERILISDEDGDVVTQWAIQTAREKREALLQLQPRSAEILARIDTEARRDQMLAGMLMMNRDAQNLIDAADFSTLRSQLSADGAAKLDSAENAMQLVRIWWLRRVGAAFRGRSSFDSRGFRGRRGGF